MNKIKLNFNIFILIANLISSNFIYTQNITLDNFSISELDGKVYADITLGVGNTCNGIKLLRATDTINFQEIVNVEGVCGNSSTSTNYNLIDENPILNAINFYKVLFGIDNYSETYEILILDFQENNYQIWPNPISSNGTLYFRNPLSSLCEFYLFKLTGEQLLTMVTNDNKLLLNLHEIPSGTYLFKLLETNTKSEFSGKIVVNH